MNYIKKHGLSLFLYGTLGVMFGIAGVGVVDKPIEFCTILGLVIAIEVVSFKQGLNNES